MTTCYHSIGITTVHISCKMAQCHKARKVKEWLGEHQIQTKEWPGHSTDLNPIKNLWKLRKLPILSVDALVETMRELWITTGPAYLKNLSDSMIKRIKFVKIFKGEMTKY